MTLFLKSLDWINKDWGMIDLKKINFGKCKVQLHLAQKKC